MKHKFLLLLAALMMWCPKGFAQSSDNEDEVVKIDKWNQGAYREGEVIVHFREDSRVQMRAPQKTQFATSAVTEVDQLFQAIGVDSIEELMPRTGNKPLPKRLRTYHGKDIEPKPLSKLYRLKLAPSATMSVQQAVDTIKTLSNVDFAEPNYLVFAMSLPYDIDDPVPANDSAIYVSEPLYSQQWGLPAIGLPQLWNKPKVSSKRPVIAILDTGVDIEHPDLAANIWTNTTESNGIAGQDDDANGFKDDLHGWDFINQTGIINDFNGHGTHCAGIAAAVGNNGIGITGANPDALIMPVTVMQSNGTGDVATIIRGIDYAAANGADVISMSFGGYSSSLAEETALGRAYANSVLVAAAGNDGKCIIPHCCPYSTCNNGPMFPAAFAFVLGVEASKNAEGKLSGFSNYDEDGPIYSTFGEALLYNYELRAPGVKILSTFPGGRYKVLNGTSMACPLVAGAISRLIQCKELYSKELLFGDLINTREGNIKDFFMLQGNINVLATYNITDLDRHAALSLVAYNLTDSIGGDNDGRADAGETIEIYPIFKNAWGQAENIRFWIKTGFNNEGDWVWDDTTLITHLQDTAYFGKQLSTYGKITSLNPWRMSINPNCADGRKINLTLFAICENTIDTLKQEITLMVENGVEIGGLYTEDFTLYPDIHYTISRPIGIPEGVTCTILPGTSVEARCSDPIQRVGDGGSLIMKGTKDSLITLSGNNTKFNFSFNKDAVYEYVRLQSGWSGIETRWDIHLPDTLIPLFKNCIICGAGGGSTHQGINLIQCKMEKGFYGPWGFLGEIINGPQFCVFEDSRNFGTGTGNIYPFPTYLDYYSSTNTIYNIDSTIYLGTSSEEKLRGICQDYNTGYGWGIVDFSTMCKRPSSKAHGVVWKILVDSIDAQDEFDLLPPIGVGTHRCDVYFNRAMDTSVTPFVAFGVRAPYTQHQVAENGSWSADSTIYTAYFRIDGKSVTDGLNTFKVYGAEDDEHFEIPEENYRFHMEVAAAGSMSTGLMATPGLGKVTLNWETDEEDFEDLLGYNIYRWTNDTIKYNNNTEYRFDTLCINTSLIDAQDTAFIDYDVVPGKAYYYIIRQMTTSLNSYDISNPVTATPLTAIKGDANGSMSVDVADIITEVNYITRQNPQPFIFEAADVNSDNVVNVIDIVGTVNLILNPQANTNALNDNVAYYYVNNGILYVESDAVIGGVQVSLLGDQGEAVTPLDALNEFEKVSMWQTEENYFFMAYSMSGKTLGVGTHALLQIGDADITNIVLSDAQGHNIVAIPQASTALDGTRYMPNSRKYIENNHLYIQVGEHVYSTIGLSIK